MEETEGPPSTVAVVEPSTGESAEISEAKRKRLWKMVEDSGEELTQEQKQQFFLLLANADLFAESDNPGRTTLVKHHVNSPPYPLHKREEAKRLLQDMLSKGVIQPSSSPWASPIVLVPKKDGRVRFCIDYRKVNAVQTRTCSHL